MDRCVSPGYDRISRVQMNAELKFLNFKKVIAEQAENEAVYRNTRLAKAKAAAAKGKGKGKGRMPGQPPGAQNAPWEHFDGEQNKGSQPMKKNRSNSSGSSGN